MGLIIDQKNYVWVFGENSSGELGVGDYSSRPSPYPLIMLQGKPIS